MAAEGAGSPNTIGLTRGRRTIGGAIVGGPIVYIAAVGLARFVGFGRESVIAYLFGTSGHTDAYLAATALPEFVAGILLSGVIGFMVIPAYVRFERAGQHAESHALLGSALGQVTIWSTSIAVLTMVFASNVVRVVAPGLAGASRGEATTILRLTAPSITFFAVAGFAGATLNARKVFLPVPVSMMIANAASIVLLLVLRHHGINAAAIAYLAAAVLTAFVQLLAVRRLGIRFPFSLRRPPPAVLAALLSGATAVLAFGTALARPFIERAFASTLEVGDIAAIGFATKLLLFAGALIAVSVGTLSFPLLAEHAAAGRTDALVRTLRRSLAWVLVMAVPASVVLVFFAGRVVSAVFERGRFGAAGAHVTSGVLAIYALGLIPICANEVVVRGLFALRQERPVLAIWTTSLLVTVVIDVLLLRTLDVRGLAVGGAVGLWVNLSLMIGWLWKTLGRSPLSR